MAEEAQYNFDYEEEDRKVIAAIRIQSFRRTYNAKLLLRKLIRRNYVKVLDRKVHKFVETFNLFNV